MQRWLTQHLEALLTLSIPAGLYFLWKSGVVQKLWRWRRFIHETESQFTQSLETRLTLEQEKVNKLSADVDRLKDELVRSVREKDLRDDINKQDRETIRLLKARLDEHNVDYSDIGPLSFERRFNAQTRDPLR